MVHEAEITWLEIADGSGGKKYVPLFDWRSGTFIDAKIETTIEVESYDVLKLPEVT